jgi:hypothetical protein
MHEVHRRSSCVLSTNGMEVVLAVLAMGRPNGRYGICGGNGKRFAGIRHSRVVPVSGRKGDCLGVDIGNKYIFAFCGVTVMYRIHQGHRTRITLTKR